MSNYYKKYLKYKNKYCALKHNIYSSKQIPKDFKTLTKDYNKILYINLKKTQLGGGYNDIEWFELRKFLNPVYNFNQYNGINEEQFLQFRSKLLGKGGQSSIYETTIDHNLLLRTIDNPNIENELNLIRMASNLVINNINPHFVNSPYIKNNIHLMERFNGDISTLAFEYKYGLHIQLLTGLISLINNGFLMTDIKKENVLYKRLSHPVVLNYNIQGETYKLITDIVFALTDYGKAYKYNEATNQQRFTSFVEFIHVVEDKEIKNSGDFKAYLNPGSCSELMDMNQVLLFLSKNAKVIKCLIAKLKHIYQPPDNIDGIPETIPFNVI
jgi:serine/threonine protein kinase